MRDRVTNGFVGGQIFAEVGPTDEVTPEMVARFDELKGRENPIESQHWLTFAWHVLNGYQQTMAAKDTAE